MSQKSQVKLSHISVRELTPKTWKNFEKLFERYGGVWGGCWCMYYHVAEGWSERTTEQNRADKKALVQNGKAHGLLLYNDGDSIGWCQFGPPKELPLIDRKKSYRHPKDFWRLTCFFVDERYRNKGVVKLLLDAALLFMKERGVKTVEAYPVDTSRGKHRSENLWPGTLKLFESAGFRVVARFGRKTKIMRKKL